MAKHFDDDDPGPEVDAALLENIERLARMPTEDLLRMAHKKLIANLLAKLDAGTIVHQEMAHLKGLLKDNGMVLGIPPEGQLKRDIPVAGLPEFGEPDWMRN